MFQILNLTAPIYLIIAVGFLAVRHGLFSKDDTRVMGRFVIQFCVPALIFRALSQRSLHDVLNAPYLIAYALGSVGVSLGMMAYAYKRRGHAMPMAAMQGLGVSASNSAFIGYPILTQTIGPAMAGVGLALSMIIENLVALPLALAMADSGGHDGSGRQRWHQTLARTLRGLLKNPMIIAILAGFAFAMLNVQLPEVLSRTVQIVATAASPVALFVIGGSLVGLKLGGVRRDIANVAVGKLVLHPLAVFCVLWLLPPLDPQLRIAAVVLAGMPMLSMYPVVAQRYHGEGFCAAALLVTTVASFVSISLLLWGMHAVLGWTP
ncbi:permease [Rhodoferax koreense]|uniref:Permease n=1 Tax=Rhodoferax koreensis TaxID=1842727 RepID=A0A1P8K233_9BURK|nr:AEC family transporter [Rhodoferax koreense]APW40068.1 permease [Rhodoferax koreense]